MDITITKRTSPPTDLHLRSHGGRMPLRPYTCNVFIIEGENSIRKFALEVESEQGWTSVYQSEALPETHLNSFMGYGIIEFSLPSTLTTRKIPHQHPTIQWSSKHLFHTLTAIGRKDLDVRTSKSKKISLNLQALRVGNCPKHTKPTRTHKQKQITWIKINCNSSCRNSTSKAR